MSIETTRLIIRPFVAADFPQVLARVSDPQVARFTAGSIPVERACDLFHKALDRQAALFPFGNRAIVLKAQSLNIGYCGLDNLPFSSERLIELSFGLNRDYWGQGYATEATRAMLTHAFCELRLDEVVAAIHPQNARSLRVAQKLGMLFRNRFDWPGHGRVNLWAISQGRFFALSRRV